MQVTYVAPTYKRHNSHWKCSEVWFKDLCQTVGSGIWWTYVQLWCLYTSNLSSGTQTLHHVQIVHNFVSFPRILVPWHSRIGYDVYLQPFAHTDSFYSFVPSTICEIHYLVMSLAHLHFLCLKHIYISILRVRNQDTPYILVYATVVSIALEHKLFIERRKRKIRYHLKESESCGSWFATGRHETLPQVNYQWEQPRPPEIAYNDVKLNSIHRYLLSSSTRRVKPLFACFVDLKKVFDSLRRSDLWTKLVPLGVSSTIPTLLQSIYANAISVVQLGSEVSSRFPCSKGVHQGCNLVLYWSPSGTGQIIDVDQK